MEQSVSIMHEVRERYPLSLACVGHSRTMPCHTYGPAVRSYYLIHYITAGCGRFICDGATYELTAGQGFLIMPGMSSIYVADEHEPWSYVWAGFDGEMAGSLVDRIGLSPFLPVFRSAVAADFVEPVYAMERISACGSAAGELTLLGSLLHFLAAVARAQKESIAAGIADGQLRLAVEYITAHIAGPMTAGEVARHVGLDRCYFSRKFSKAMGQPPRHYIQSLRLTLARHILESANLSLDEIAARSGYQSAEAFSKAFRKRYGVAPGAYRSVVKNSGHCV